MKVALIDVDSKMPNLALMKLSSYHKQRGDEVKFYEPLFDHPDLCYASKVFDFTPDADYFPDCKVVKGGTGYDLHAKLPEEAESVMPDYDLYGGCAYSLGRFTRGCPNNCPWCVVPKMDGNTVREVARLEDFWDKRHSVVRLMDDNILADGDIFARACEQLSRAGVKAVWEALDIRLVDSQSAKALASVKNEKLIHFSWDSHAQDSAIAPGIALLERSGIKPYRLMFYVLIGFGTAREYDLHRVMTLHSLGANPFVMPFDKSDRYQMDFARWCNNKVIFKSTSWEKYSCPTNRERERNVNHM